MILGLELAGAYLGGSLSTVAVAFFGGRWLLRKKYGGLLDLIGATPTKP